MDKGVENLKFKRLIVICTEYLLYKALSKKIDLVVSADCNRTFEVDCLANKTEQTLEASCKKSIKKSASEIKIFNEPIFSLQETLPPKKMRNIQQSNINLDCPYLVKKMRIRNKVKRKICSLELFLRK